ncbi:MAG: RNA polymerase sigma factor, partial [Acidimicrobiales bacterium]
MTALRYPLAGEEQGDPRALTDVESLTAAAREGDRDAFEQLVRATSPACYQLALRLVGNEHDARDVVQETYIRAYRGLKRFRGDASVTTWLYRITATGSARHLERRRRTAHAQLDDSVVLVEMRPERLPEPAASSA